MNTSHLVLGIDIGGSSLKGALVDVTNGLLTTEPLRVETPEPATPSRVIDAIREIMEHFSWNGDTGYGFPGVITNGIVRTAANLAPEWAETNIYHTFTPLTKGTTGIINDADAAGIAEMTFGSGKSRNRENGGIVMMVTFGTGIGTAMFVDGMLVPNLEFGHIEIDGEIAEKRASAAARRNEDLNWEQWGLRVNRYMQKLERLTNPDLFIIGGGVSERSERFLSYIKTRAEITTAQLCNEAGIAGAALTVPYLRKRHLL